MSRKRFAAKANLPPEMLVLYENLGLTVHAAQLYEGFMQNALTGLERLGRITIPPDIDRSQDGFIDSCLGPMVRIIESSSDRESIRLLKRANRQRNVLMHSFLRENALDLANAAGCAATNDKLHRIHVDILAGLNFVLQASVQIWESLGVSREENERRVREFISRVRPTKNDSTE